MCICWIYIYNYQVVDNNVLSESMFVSDAIFCTVMQFLLRIIGLLQCLCTEFEPSADRSYQTVYFT